MALFLSRGGIRGFLLIKISLKTILGGSMFKKLSVLFLSGALLLCLAPLLQADFNVTSKNLSNSSTPSVCPKVVRIPGTANVFVFWIEDGASSDLIWFAKSTDSGTTWSAPQQITTWGEILTGSWDYDLNVFNVVVEDSILHLVFQHRDDDTDTFDIYYQRSADYGDNWGYGRWVTDNSTDTLHPDVAVRGDYVHICFQDNWPGNYDIMYKRINGAGTGSIDQNRRLTYSSTYSVYPKIAVSLSGITVNIAYEDWESTAYQLYFKHIYDYGAGSHQTNRLTSGSYWNGMPDIAFSTAAAPDDDYCYIVYQAYWPGNREIMYKRLTSWGQPGFTTYTARLSYSDTDSYNNSIAFDGAYNNIHIAFFDNWPGNNDIMYRNLDDFGGDGFTSMRVSWGSGDSIDPAVADSGRWAHIVWSDDTSGNYEIYWKYGRGY
jgi:hypothetical protein